MSDNTDPEKILTHSISLVPANRIEIRRESVFLILAGIFLSSMTMLNIIGITRFIQLGPLALAIGVLPYPATFLCTDFISEFYGRKKANFLVMIGLVVNLFVIFFMWAGSLIPSVDPSMQPPWQVLTLQDEITLADGSLVVGQVETYKILFACTTGAVLASMLAYLAAQFCDVYLFHFWKKLTKGKHLWLRNNGSTLVSQLVDSVAVIFITFRAKIFSGDMQMDTVMTLLWSNYLFKMVAALLDTIPFYLGVNFLKGYLQIDPNKEH